MIWIGLVFDRVKHWAFTNTAMIHCIPYKHGLLGCDAVLFGRQVHVFQRNPFPSKCYYLYIKLYGVTSKKTINMTFTIAKISNLTQGISPDE
jgi:hypothetical protein